jgi:hypothetical protein
LVGKVEAGVGHHLDHFLMDLVGGMGAAGQDFDALLEATSGAFALGERGRHLGTAGVLDAHEGDTNRLVRRGVGGHDRGRCGQ